MKWKTAALAWALGAQVAWAATANEPPPPEVPATDIDVPGTSSTIRMLLDLQSSPAPVRAAEAERPRPSGMPPSALRVPTVVDSPGVDVVDEEGREPPSRSLETPPDEIPNRSDSAKLNTTADRPSLEREPSAIRSFVAYLREHRTEVFVSGLLALALAAVATGVSARRRAGRGARGGRGVSSARTASSTRRRRPHARRS